MINNPLCMQIYFIRQFVCLWKGKAKKIIAEFYVLNIVFLTFITFTCYLRFCVFLVLKLLREVLNYKISCKIIEFNLWRSEITHRNNIIVFIHAYFYFIIINQFKFGYLDFWWLIYWSMYKNVDGKYFLFEKYNRIFEFITFFNFE